MSNKNIEKFVETYGPIAQQVSKDINVDPNVLLSQWGMETGWGKYIVPGTNNLGNIKDFSGRGVEATDSKTKSKDKYLKFEDPEVFGMYYADMIRRNFPEAANTGPDVGAFTRGLANGKYGSYYEIPQSEYLKSLTGAQDAIPADKQLPFQPTDVNSSRESTGKGDMVLAGAPPSPPPEVDTSGASAGERFLFGALGTGAGVLSTSASGISDARARAAATRAGSEERARIAAQRAAGVTPPTAPGAPVAPGAPGGPPQGGVRVQAPGGGPMQLGAPGTYPKATGPGSATYNYGRVYGLPEIEAGRALGTGQGQGEVWDMLKKRQESLNRIKQMGGGFTENPRYGGIMTPEQSVGSGPRQSFAFKPEVPPSPEVPKGIPGGLQQLPKTTPIPTTPPPPTIGARLTSGLDSVNNMFKSMMRPVASAALSVGRYAVPPLAGLSAGLDLAEVVNEYNKPEDQRDYTKMKLKGASTVGGALSMIPSPWTQGIGIPLSLGASAIQAYREDPKYFNQKFHEYTGYSPQLSE